MEDIEGPFYAKVEYRLPLLVDENLHEKLGLGDVEYAQIEVELSKIKKRIGASNLDNHKGRTCIDLYVIATPIFGEGNYFFNDVFLRLFLEDGEWKKIEEEVHVCDIEDVEWDVGHYEDVWNVEPITEEEYNNNVRK